MSLAALIISRAGKIIGAIVNDRELLFINLSKKQKILINKKRKQKKNIYIQKSSSLKMRGCRSGQTDVV